MKVEKDLSEVRIDGVIKVEAPEGWGEEAFYHDDEFGEVKRDYNLLANHIEDKLEEVGMKADIDFIDNAGDEKENLRFVIEQ